MSSWRKKQEFSQEDAEALKEALKTLFENDSSSARPEGSMEVCRLYWWQHEEKNSVDFHRKDSQKCKNCAEQRATESIRGLYD